MSKPKNHNTNWSKEDDAILEEMWGTYTVNGIARKLQRTPRAIHSRAKAKGLGGFTDVGIYINRNQAAHMVGVDYKVLVRNWEVNHDLVFKRISITSKKAYICAIKFDDFIKWLKDHQELWDSRRVKEYALGTEPEWLIKKREQDNKSTLKFTGTKYTPKEDQIIIACLKRDMTQKQIAERLNRTEGSVNGRIGRLDVWGTGKLKKGVKKCEEVGAV